MTNILNIPIYTTWDIGMYDPKIGDFALAKSSVYSWENLISTQIGSLYFTPTLGIDYDMWILSEKKYSAESFYSYLSMEGLKYSLFATNFNYHFDGIKQYIEITDNSGSNNIAI